MTDKPAPEIPAQGGSYVRQKDGTLVREEWTAPPPHPADAPAPEPQPADEAETAPVGKGGKRVRGATNA